MPKHYIIKFDIHEKKLMKILRFSSFLKTAKFDSMENVFR